MPSTPNRSRAVIHASPSTDPGLCCPKDALETSASPAEELSPPQPTITEHGVILGTAAAIAVTPSLEGGRAPRAIGHLRLVERRRNRQHSQSPVAALKQLPAVVVLKRIPVPVLAIAHDGSILFTNTAFAQMVGRERDEVLSLRFHQIFHRVPASESLLSVVHVLANMIVELAHKDGSIVRARMSRSALMRADDQFALAVFQDLTEQLWETER
jgi:PAS domain S-box-containing protein